MPGRRDAGTLKNRLTWPKSESMSARLLFAGRPGGLVWVPPGSAVLRLAANLVLGGSSAACGFAAVAVALYAGSPQQAWAVVLFAGFGFVAGLLCGGLHAVFDGLPVQPAAAMPPDALASLVRATLVTAIAERAPRSGSAADRRPTPAELATTALAGAAVTSMTAPMAHASAAVAQPAPPAAPVIATAAAQAIGRRRFAPSEFGV